MTNKYYFQRSKKIIFFIILFIIAIIFVKHFQLQEIWKNGLTLVENLGIWGSLLYILIYNVATLLFVPGSLLTMKGGCLFGPVWGFIYVLIAAIVGSIWAFILGRYLSRDWVYKKFGKNPKFQAINKAVEKEGWKIVFLTRLSPLFPFNLLNYIFGITNVSLKDYIIGSIGMIPGTIMYVYIGSLATDLSTITMSNYPSNTETQMFQWIIRIIGLIATVALTVYINKIAKQALNKTIETDEQTYVADNHD